MKDTFFTSPHSVNCGGVLLDFSTPRVMGILNVTPDSFYADSRVPLTETAVKTAGRMLAEGADILDIGGYSSRPGAMDVSEQEEIQRVIPVIDAVHSAHPDAILSVDTFRAEVAKRAVAAGAHIINDISGGSLDNKIWSIAAELQVPYILMHMRGNPQNMQDHTQYNDLLQELMHYFSERIATMRDLGVGDIIVDPGFGFAKTREQGFELLANLSVLHNLKCPLMVGVSRKSMIWKTLNTTPDQALNGSTVLHTLALQQGAHLLRVHDVKEAAEAVMLWCRVRDASV